MNWDQWAEEFCEKYGCSTAQMACVSADGSVTKKQLSILTTQRKDIYRAMEAVKKAYELNPNATRQQMKKQTYKFLTSSIMLSILVSIVISLVTKLAVEWLLDNVFNQK